MCEHENIGSRETLFSLEIFVQSVRIERELDLSDHLAVALRLLDFPALLVPQPRTSGALGGAERAFNRGKCCFFSATVDSLHSRLSNAPLRVLVLDGDGDVPRLVGESLVPLAGVAGRVRADVARRGLGSPSAHGERGRFGVRSLAGDTIGHVRLSYRALSLGVGGAREGRDAAEVRSARPPTPEGGGDRSLPASGDRPAQEDPEDGAWTPVRAGNGKSPGLREETETSPEEDPTVFRPPHLFFCNTREEAREKRREAQGLGSGSLAFVAADWDEEDEEEEEETVAEGDARDPGAAVKPEESPIRNQQTQTSGPGPTPLGEALRGLPLLSALLLELSQLDRPPTDLPPPPPSPSPARPDEARRAPAEAGPRAGSLSWPPRPPRTRSGPGGAGKGENKRGRAPSGKRSSGTSPRKTAAYGENRAFHLRLEKVSRLKERRRECSGLPRGRERRGAEGRTAKPARTPAAERGGGLDGSIETAMQRLALREAVTAKRRKTWEKHHGSGIPGKPGSDGDSAVVRGARGRSERRSPPDSGGRGGIRSSRPGSAFPESSGEEEEEAEYSDDFNSLHPSDGPSPDRGSRTPGPPDLCRSGSGSERSGADAAALPAPIKSAGSPRRSLSSTYVIRPRTTTSALSFSSDDAGADGSPSPPAGTGSGKRGAGTSSDSGSFASSGGRSGNDDDVPVRGISAGSRSSLEPEEVEEVGDDLGTLDFRKEYRNISDLLASNLPGYTI